MDSYLLVIKMV